MTIKRFLVWLMERLIELQLAIAGLLAVKFLLPVSAQSYSSARAFARGVRETWRAGVDDASFMTHAFMNGDWVFYAWKTWLASAWVIGVFVYLQGLYLFTSLLGRSLSDGKDLRNAVVAFLVSFAVLCGLHVQNTDAGSLRLAACMIFGGLAVVTMSTLFGKLFAGRPVAKAAPVRRVVFSEPDVSSDLPDVANAPIIRRERLYLSD